MSREGYTSSSRALKAQVRMYLIPLCSWHCDKKSLETSLVRTARFCVQEGCFFPCKIMTPFSHHLTPPRHRTGESMHLVCFWPSPTPRARRERQRGASGMRWWVGTARFCVQEGCFFPCTMKVLVCRFATADHLCEGFFGLLCITSYRRIKLQNGLLSAANTRANYLPYL
jgi:hypothetical protein